MMELLLTHLGTFKVPLSPSPPLMHINALLPLPTNDCGAALIWEEETGRLGPVSLHREAL